MYALRFVKASDQLSAAQRAALRSVEVVAESLRADADRRLRLVIAHAGLERSVLDEVLDRVRQHARVVVHFHPDRLARDGRPVSERLIADRRYSSQFETGLSSGSRSAHPGGERDDWERRLFGGAYQAPGVAPSERPKYGALELIRHADGPWPRFGSCYLVLKPAVSARTTFSFSGSEKDAVMQRVGTIDIIESVLAPLFEEVAAGEGTEVPWPPYRAPSFRNTRTGASSNTASKSSSSCGTWSFTWGPPPTPRNLAAFVLGLASEEKSRFDVDRRTARSSCW